MSRLHSRDLKKKVVLSSEFEGALSVVVFVTDQPTSWLGSRTGVTKGRRRAMFRLLACSLACLVHFGCCRKSGRKEKKRGLRAALLTYHHPVIVNEYTNFVDV